MIDTNHHYSVEPHVLDFSNTYYGDEKCSEILIQAQKATYPTRLDLRGNRFEASGAKSIAEFLLQNPNHNIVSLSLEWNNVGILDQGIEALARALEKDTRIISLDLRNNNIGPRGGIALAQALKFNRTLKQLDLRWNELGDTGILALQEALREVNRTIVEMEVMGNNISARQADEIDKLVLRNQENKSSVDENAFIKSSPSTPLNSVSYNDDNQLLLQLLAEKESLERELDEKKTAIRCFEDKIERYELQVSLQTKQLQTLKDELALSSQREADMKKEIQNVKLHSEEVDRRHKNQIDNCEKIRTENERDIHSLQGKLLHEETFHTQVLAKLNAQLHDLEKKKSLLESANHKFEFLVRTQKEEIDGLQQKIEKIGFEHQDSIKKLNNEHEYEAQSLKRRYEQTVGNLNNQNLTLASQLKEEQNKLTHANERFEELQTALLQCNVAHELDIIQKKQTWEEEMSKRVNNSVQNFQQQIDRVSSERKQLEMELEAQRAKGLRLDEESLKCQQQYNDTIDKLQGQINEQALRINKLCQENLAHEKNVATCDRKIEELTQSLKEENSRLDQLKVTTREEIQRLIKERDELSTSLRQSIQQKAETITGLQNTIGQLERSLAAEKFETGKRMARLGESVASYIQDHIIAERERLSRNEPEVIVNGDSSKNHDVNVSHS